jgi:site-specific recombinase XerD
MVEFAYRHGLRVSELVEFQRTDIRFNEKRLWVKRKKRGVAHFHSINGQEVRDLKRVIKEGGDSRYLFVTNRGGPFTTKAFEQMLKRAAARVDDLKGLRVHPHMLRHGRGHVLVNDGTDTRRIQEFLGHRSIQHTVRYTHLDEDKLEGLEECR